MFPTFAVSLRGPFLNRLTYFQRATAPAGTAKQTPTRAIMASAPIWLDSVVMIEFEHFGIKYLKESGQSEMMGSRFHCEESRRGRLDYLSIVHLSTRQVE